MHAIMSETYTNKNFQTVSIEVVDKDPGTGTDVVIARYDVNIPVSDTTETLYSKAREALMEQGFHAGTWQDIGGCWRAPVSRSESPESLSEEKPSAQPIEADEMLAISQTLALRALQICNKTAAEASVGNRDPRKNHTYMKARAALDAHCDQLAHLMWTHKHHAAGGSAISEYPSGAMAEQYLRGLADKAQEPSEAEGHEYDVEVGLRRFRAWLDEHTKES